MTEEDSNHISITDNSPFKSLWCEEIENSTFQNKGIIVFYISELICCLIV